jgi:hypothetical protein
LILAVRSNSLKPEPSGPGNTLPVQYLEGDKPMRIFIPAVVATALIASGALADDSALAPGKPAGVKQAQAADHTLLIEVGMAAVVGGLAAVLASGSHNTAPITTTVPSTAP